MPESVEMYFPGLEGVIAGETAISSVEQDGLRYRGYDVADLAAQASFEEVAWLLLHGELPASREREEFQRALASHLTLPPLVTAVLRQIPPQVEMMDALRTGLSLAAHYDASPGQGRARLMAQATRVIGLIPALIGARLRASQELEPLTPQPGLSHAAQTLYLALGQPPTALHERVLNLTLILYAEHEFNASTFAARVCASTLSDLYSAVVAAIATLKGPLHGGANEAASRLIQQFRSADEARRGIRDMLARKERIMGFGHRVYKHGDHRARIVEACLPELAAQRGEPWRVEVYRAIKETMWEEKQLHPNLDFPCGLAYFLLGLPVEIYTPLFVAARASGWCAHIIEQLENNRLIRPRSRYTGPPARRYVAAADRGGPGKTAG